MMAYLSHGSQILRLDAIKVDNVSFSLFSKNVLLRSSCFIQAQ
jgi:hypothetical protein